MKVKEQLERELCQRDLHYYIQQAWKVIEPGINYIDNWHIEAICEYLEAVKLGQIKRLVINMPPRYMKSISVTVGFPTWMWTTQPEKRFISLSYSATLSKKHNINRRDIIKSPWYQTNWRHKFNLKQDMDTQMKFENDKTGFMFATSIGGTLTGEGGDYIIVDDPHNPENAHSDAERETAVEFFRSTLPTRLNDKENGAIIVVMQRLHELDVSGHCLKHGGYEHLCLPAIANKRMVVTLPISKKEIVREENDILFTKRENKKLLAQMKEDMGSYNFSGQYQQEPSPSEGGDVKKWWIRYWKPKDMNLPPVKVQKPIKDGYTTIEIQPIDLPDENEFDMMLQSWDLAFKDKKDNDPVGCHIYANKGAKIFLLDRLNKNIGFTDTLTAFEDMKNKWKDSHLKLVEDKANGPAVIDVLQHKIGGIIPIKPEGSKQARLHAVTPYIEAGNVYLPHPDLYDWSPDVIDQLIKFPKAAHDEDVDCMSQGLYRFIYMHDEVVDTNNKINDEDDIFEDNHKNYDYEEGGGFWDD